HVRFRWKDYRANGKSKMMTLPAGEFIRRFLLHVVPDGFRIRHFGFLANAHRSAKLAQVRAALPEPAEVPACLSPIGRTIRSKHHYGPNTVAEATESASSNGA